MEQSMQAGFSARSNSRAVNGPGRVRGTHARPTAKIAQAKQGDRGMSTTK